MSKFILSPNLIPIFIGIGMAHFDRSIIDLFIGAISLALYQIAEVSDE